MGLQENWGNSERKENVERKNSNHII